MLETLAALTYPFAAVPAFGEAQPVAPGVWWVRMPLPFALDHVNLWLLEDGDGWTVVDTGVADDRTRALWGQLVAGLMGGRPVRRVVCTHFHPDHMGLAGWMAEQWGAPLWATLAEWLYGRMLALDEGPAQRAAQVEFYRRCGFDGPLLVRVAERGNAYAPRVVPMPPQLRRIANGDAIDIGGRTWRVVTGGGHCPEHACLHCPELGVLIAGDQILPRISPNVSVWPSEPEAEPLGRFLDSLDHLATLPADTLVLPSHGRPFHGLRVRADELRRHHDERLAETLDACARPITALDLRRTLFPRELDFHQLFFAVGESVAHLHRLTALGHARREADGDGVWSFRRS